MVGLRYESVVLETAAVCEDSTLEVAWGQEGDNRQSEETLQLHMAHDQR